MLWQNISKAIRFEFVCLHWYQDLPNPRARAPWLQVVLCLLLNGTYELFESVPEAKFRRFT